MKPNRKEKIGDTEIHEYYWSGSMVVYVNHRRFEGTFEEAIEHECSARNEQNAEKLIN